MVNGKGTLHVSLSAQAPRGRSHEERLTAARRIMDAALAKHGDVILAIGIYGTTAIGLDGPYSDLDMTFMTRVAMGDASEVTTRDGLLLNLDYQTWEESVAEANDPELAGTWADILVLHDPDNLFPALRAIAGALTDEQYRKAFAKKVADDVTTALGKIRNAVVAADRASFRWACAVYAEAVCRAICLRNRRYVTGRAQLRALSKQMSIVPGSFPTLIDTVSGAHPATDQEVYEAAEVLWERVQDLPS